MNNQFWLTDIKTLRIKEYKKLISLYEDNGKEEKAEDVKIRLRNFIWLCNNADEKDILEDVKCRLTDYYQVIAGYYYTIAEDFKDNPFIKIDRLKKAVIVCNRLKEHNPDAAIFANKYICKVNRNYLR